MIWVYKLVFRSFNLELLGKKLGIDFSKLPKHPK